MFLQFVYIGHFTCLLFSTVVIIFIVIVLLSINYYFYYYWEDIIVLSIHDFANILFQNLPPGMSMHDFAIISALPVNTSLPGTIGVDFGDSTQPVSFTISSGSGHSCHLTLKAPVGELVRAVTMPEPLFITEQSECHMLFCEWCHSEGEVTPSSPIRVSVTCYSVSGISLREK